MIVFGHLWGLIVVGVISASPVGDRPAVFALCLDGGPPLLQSLCVLPQVLRWSIFFRKVLVPREDG